MKGSSNAPKIVHSNKNLLDNWDFTNPVNQRGKTSYVDAGYTIDRWKKNGGTISVKSKHVNLLFESNSAAYSNILQVLDADTISAIAGKTITISADCAVNSLDCVPGTYEGFYIAISNDTKGFSPGLVITSTFSRKIISFTYDVPSNWEPSDYIRFSIGSLGKKLNVDIYSAKLELGEVSTLKNDVLGVSYAEELLKCQRYYYDSRTESAISDGRIRMTEAYNYPSVITGDVFFPVQMRAKPAITIYSDQGNVGNLNNGINGEELTGLGAYANFYGRDCFSQVDLNKPLSQVTTVKEVCFHYTASADL